MRTRRLGYWVLAAVLASRLLAAAAPSRAEIQRLIGGVGDRQFAAREAAQRQLLELGASDYQAVLEESLRVYAATSDPEVRYRLQTVMAGLVGKYIFAKPRGFLGIQFSPGTGPEAAPAAGHFIAVVAVIADSGAEKAGVQPGDQILAVDQKDLSGVTTTGPFLEYVQSRAPGDQVKLKIRRGDQSLAIAVTLGDLPEDVRSRLDSDERREEFFKTWLQTQLEALPRPGR